MTSSRGLFFLLLSFILGISAESFFEIPSFIIAELFVLGISFIILWHTDKRVLFFASCILILGLGILRMNLENPINEAKVLKIYEPAPIVKVFEPVKDKIRDKIYQSFSPPNSSILAALTLGDKSKISQEWKKKLNFAGVRHLVAISGLHIVLLSTILMWLFIVLGFYRGVAIYPTIIALWFFIIFTGIQPSAIRAGIMGSLFLYSQRLGRGHSGTNALLLAGAIMLCINPLILRYNLGFQLSFLATLGIMHFTPIFKDFLKKARIFSFLDISYLLAITLSAQILTFPIIVYNFKYFSLVAPITNIIIVPLLPFLMILGFLFIFASFAPFVAIIFYIPLFLLLSFTLNIIGFFAGLPISYFSLSISWIFAVLYYAGISIGLYLISRRSSSLV